MDHVIRSTGTEATVADTVSMIVVLAAMPFLARVVKRVGSRTSIWIGTGPYVVGCLLLFFAVT